MIYRFANARETINQLPILKTGCNFGSAIPSGNDAERS
jgi:hypothetical protein